MKNSTKIIRRCISYSIPRLLPTKIYLKVIYKHCQGKRLNLKSPQTLNEKIQWKKIYDKNQIYTIYADKYAVRDYVKEKIGEKYLIPLLFHTNKPDEINFGKIQIPFIIKSNHGSGHTIFIKNKKEINNKDIIKKCKRWLKTNFYYNSKEWHYKNIKPRILIEKLLLDEKGNIPKDYKFNCFHGKVEFIAVDTDRFGNHKRSFFDKNWKLFPFIWAPKVNGKPKYEIKKDTPKPRKLKEMIKIAEKLSKNFDYVRVDLYYVKNRIYFGELTFTPASGLESFFPQKWDLIWGKKLKLNKKGKMNKYKVQNKEVLKFSNETRI